MDEKRKGDLGGVSPRPIGEASVRLSSRRRQPNTTVGSPKSVLEHNGVQGVIKVELSDSQDEASSSVGLVAIKKAASPKKSSGKRAIINVDAHWSSDEEEFAGFGELNGSIGKLWGRTDCKLGIMY